MSTKEWEETEPGRWCPEHCLEVLTAGQSGHMGRPQLVCQMASNRGWCEALFCLEWARFWPSCKALLSWAATPCMIHSGQQWLVLGYACEEIDKECTVWTVRAHWRCHQRNTTCQQWKGQPAIIIRGHSRSKKENLQSKSGEKLERKSHPTKAEQENEEQQ